MFSGYCRRGVVSGLTQRLAFIQTVRFSAGEHVDPELVISAVGFSTGLFKGVGSGEYHTHAAMSLDFRLAEDAHLCARLFEHPFKRVHFDLVCVTLYHDSP